ncbi:MAG: DUF1579 family protein [Candidatus Acidiferrales bacterium]|jgi:hypothetical protein
MHRIRVLLVVLVACFATTVQAQKPDPEVKKLHAYLGHWTYEGKAKPGPGCLGGKFTGEKTCQMILGGSFLQCRFTEKEPDGEFRGFSIAGYDPVNKNFTSDGYAEGGIRGSNILSISGNKWTYAGRWVSEGKQYQYKGTFTFAPGLEGGTFTDELSLDGKTWTTCEESKYTKVKPPPKK